MYLVEPVGCKIDPKGPSNIYVYVLLPTFPASPWLVAFHFPNFVYSSCLIWVNAGSVYEAFEGSVLDLRISLECHFSSGISILVSKHVPQNQGPSPYIQWFCSDFGNQSFPAIFWRQFRSTTILCSSVFQVQGKWPPKRAGDGKTTLRWWYLGRSEMTGVDLLIFLKRTCWRHLHFGWQQKKSEIRNR